MIKYTPSKNLVMERTSFSQGCTLKIRATTFTLVAGDFGIKVYSREDTLYSLTFLHSLWEKMTGQVTCSLTLPSSYTVITESLIFQYQNLSKTHLTRICIHLHSKPQHSPHIWLDSSYEAEIRMDKPQGTSISLSNDGKD